LVFNPLRQSDRVVWSGTKMMASLSVVPTTWR